MRIIARSKIKTELYESHPEAIKEDLRQSACNELLKHKIFIEPPLKYINGYTEVNMVFFAIGYTEIDRLKELAELYPEIKNTLQDIIVNKVT